MELLDSVLKVIGFIVIAGGGLSLIVFHVFKYLGEKWLDSKFDERLQALKHEQGKELERLRFKISTALDRATKLHQREFDVLPDAWSKLNDAYWTVRRFVSPLQQYPDIDRMTKAQQEEFIAKCGFADWEKNQLQEARDKNEFYQEHIFWHNLNDPETKAREAYSYSLKNGIFINEVLRGKFAALHDLIWDALVQRKINERDKIIPVQRDKIASLNSHGDELMKDLERIVHDRLWPKDSL